MKVTARHLKLKQLFPTLQPLQACVVEINRTVSNLLLEEMGLNIGNAILIRLVGDKQVKFNCMATDFGVTNGLMQTRSFIIETGDAILDVSGNINLA